MNSTQKSIKVLSKVKAPVFTGLDGEVYMKGVVLSINPKITDQDQDCIIKLTEDYSERGDMFSIHNHITVKIMLLESVDEDKLSYKQWLESIDIRKNIIDGYSPTGQPLTPEEIEVLKFNEEEGKYIHDLETNAEKGFIKDLEEEEEEEEAEYYNYGECLAHIQVAGGGLSNGNSYANIELMGGKYYYVEYGSNPSSTYRGNKIKWITDKSFNIIDEDEDKYIETYSETTQHIFDLESKIMGLQAENSLLQRENNSLKLIKDTVLTDKGQKKLDKALIENQLLKLKLDNMAINEKDYKLQAIKLITDKACLSKELADIKNNKKGSIKQVVMGY